MNNADRYRQNYDANDRNPYGDLFKEIACVVGVVAASGFFGAVLGYVFGMMHK